MHRDLAAFAALHHAPPIERVDPIELDGCREIQGRVGTHDTYDAGLMPFARPVLSATFDEQAQCLRAFSALRAAHALAHFVEGEKRPKATLELVYVQQLGSLALRTVGIETVSPHQI